MKPFGPVQAKIGFAAFVVAVNCTVGTAQVRFPPVAEAEGWVVFPTTEVEAVAVQPLLLFVTDTLYVPAMVTEGDCWVEAKPPGPVHAKSALPAFVATVTFVVGFVQEIAPPFEAIAVGGLVVELTVATSVEVQPLVVFVTFNV